MCQKWPQEVTVWKSSNLGQMGASAFCFPVVDVWNALPNTVVIALSLNSFKSRLNKHWHGYELKFSALCYIPGETVLSNFVRRYPNGSSKAVLLLWIFYVFRVFTMPLCVSVYMCLVVTCWERADLLPLVCGVWLWVCHFPRGILGQVWYLIVSIPDLCTLTYLEVV